MAYLGVTLLLAMAGTPGAASADAGGDGERSRVKYFALHCLLLMFLIGL